LESINCISIRALRNSLHIFPADNFKTHHRPPEGRPPRTADLDLDTFLFQHPFIVGLTGAMLSFFLILLSIANLLR
jgi:hypothetical protein